MPPCNHYLSESNSWNCDSVNIEIEKGPKFKLSNQQLTTFGNHRFSQVASSDNTIDNRQAASVNGYTICAISPPYYQKANNNHVTSNQPVTTFTPSGSNALSSVAGGNVCLIFFAQEIIVF